MAAPVTQSADTGAHLLLADDDPTFCQVLAGALTRRGFRVSVAHDVDEAIRTARRAPPGYAVVDLRMPGRSGLELVRALVVLDPGMRIVVLTGYASIATAVEAVKLGATYYLAKPADADEVVAAFERSDGDALVEVPDRALSVDRLAWEYIQRTLSECGGNVSAAARRLGMHRRTLQRKLRRYPAPE